MPESEARRIFDHKWSMCRVFGGDVRRQCLDAGVPGDLIDRFMTQDSRFEQFMSRHDDLGNRVK
jgi:hypothetical protein